MQEDVGEEDDDLEPAVEERDVETFDDSEFYQQLLKEFLEGSAVGSGAGALVASAGGVRDCSGKRPPCQQMLEGILGLSAQVTQRPPSTQGVRKWVNGPKRACPVPQHREGFVEQPCLCQPARS